MLIIVPLRKTGESFGLNMNNDTNASGPIAGFIYQIYYFLYRLLTMRKGETVSLEKFEDVGAENDEGRTYYQLKHTTTITGATVERMRNRDTDLWKTLSMWIDKIESQGDEEAQRKWIEESEFILLSNKSTEENEFFKKVDVYKKENKWDNLKQYIKEQAAIGTEKEESSEGKEKKTIRTYTKHVNDYPLLNEFLLKVKPESKSDDDIASDIDFWLVNQQHFREANAKNLRRTLYGKISEMLRGKALEYDLVSFDKEFGELFRKMKDRKFVATNKVVVVPEKPMEQTFIKQLRDIDDFKSKSIDKVKELTEQRLRFENDYNNALVAGSNDDRVSFERDVKTRWDNHFGEQNDGINEHSTPDDIKNAAKAVVKGVRDEHLLFDGEPLNTDYSNGCFYYFSDGKTPKIGWRYDWKEKYNGEEWTIE